MVDEGVAYSTWAYPSESHRPLWPEAMVLPMLESMAPGRTELQRMPSLRKRQATFLVAPICARFRDQPPSISLTRPTYSPIAIKAKKGVEGNIPARACSRYTPLPQPRRSHPPCSPR